MKNKNKNILVTGGSGFIGKYLVDGLLKKGYNVSILDRSPKKTPPKVKVFKTDIRDKEQVEQALNKVDQVYHLAGLLGTEELNTKSVEAAQINIIGTLNILDAARSNQTSVLLVSKPNVWLNTYSITKETSEKFCMMYRKEFGLKATIVKWFSVYGPGQKIYGVQKAVPTFIVRALQNKPLPIFDSGKQEADFIYTSDAIQATIMTAENNNMEGKTVQIGTGKGTKVLDLAKLIIKLCQSKSKLKFLKMRGGEDPGTRVIADTTILEKIGFKPQVDLEQGLKTTISHYKKLLK